LTAKEQVVVLKRVYAARLGSGKALSMGCFLFGVAVPYYLDIAFFSSRGFVSMKASRYAVNTGNEGGMADLRFGNQSNNTFRFVLRYRHSPNYSY